MNPAAVTREELLEAAQRMVKEQGLGALNIRGVASACGISVGCIYNYFPSKSHLVAGVMEHFWSDAFHRGAGGCASREGTPFPEFLEETYAGLRRALAGFSAEFLSQMSLLSPEDREQGRRREAQCFGHMRRGLVEALRQDRGIPERVWQGKFTPEALGEFAFYAMMDLLRRGEPDCGVLAELVRRVLSPGTVPENGEEEGEEDRVFRGNNI